MFCYKLILVDDKYFMYVYDGDKIIGLIPLDKNQSTSMSKVKEYEERFGWKQCTN
ncbi:uncharacterised protein [Saccharolobus solfataricus]|uniref:Uncharacterized protein n=2 Tax=Saccharolobus solfataricus TaxID=2287 RepID=A0A157T434_SACSO|nr:uncharacterised protein [Saccharolobus solfataricus]